MTAAAHEQLPDWLNALTVIGSAVGALSAILAVNITVSIFAYRQLRFAAYRAIAGAFVGNIIFSTVNAVPAAYNDFALVGLMGHVALRSLYFMAMFLTAGYEALMLVMAWWSLRNGNKPLPFCIEFTCHTLCLIMAVAVWLGTLLKGYFLLDHEHLLGETVAPNTTNFRHDYEKLVADTTAVWMTLIFGCTVLWLILVTQIWQQRKDIDRTRQVIAEWPFETDRQKRYSLIANFERSVKEIARPIGEYGAVYLIFAIPTAVMMSNPCNNTSPDGLHCILVCEFLLCFRTLACCTVFLRNLEDRQRTFQWRVLYSKLWSSSTVAPVSSFVPANETVGEPAASSGAVLSSKKPRPKAKVTFNDYVLLHDIDV